MKKKEIWDYIQVGTNLRYIQDCTSLHSIIHKDGPRDNIRRLLKDFEELGLNVTKRASDELSQFLKELDKITDDRQFTDEEIEKLYDIMGKLRHTMEAECLGTFSYITTEKRYDIAKLFDNIEKLFAPNIFTELPELAQYDFYEAGKCIVFERSTAAAFHILRATELVLAKYYRKFMRKDPTKKTWGQLLSELKNKSTGKRPNPIIINHLVNIKDSFRNPTQHPTKIYDIQEAQDLLSVCIDVVNRMSIEIK